MKLSINKKVCRTAAIIMLIGSVIFFIYALNHPEGSFPWGNGVTLVLFTAYEFIMAILFILSFKDRRKY